MRMRETACARRAYGTSPGSVIPLAISPNGCHSKRHAGGRRVSDWFTMLSIILVGSEGAGLLAELWVRCGVQKIDKQNMLTYD